MAEETGEKKDMRDAIPLLIDIIENDPENAESALGILKNITEMTAIPDDCMNHVADSWGACENCGRLVF